MDFSLRGTFFRAYEQTGKENFFRIFQNFAKNGQIQKHFGTFLPPANPFDSKTAIGTAIAI